MSDQFKTKRGFHYFTAHCFAPFFFFGYFLTIPSTAEPSWYKLQQTIYKYKIDTNWLNLVFVIGMLLANAIEMKGTFRQILIKVNTIFVIVLVLAWFVPFREGNLIMRFFYGILISLDIRYSTYYYRMIIRPIEAFQQIKFPNQDELIQFGAKQSAYQFVAFGLGITLQGLMSLSYPSQEMLGKLRIYDDTVLWKLLISMPSVILAIRLINLHLSFNYDEIKNVPETHGEYFLANMLKKKYMEEAIDMFHEKKLVFNDRFEIQNYGYLKFISAVCFSTSTFYLCLFSNRIPPQQFNLDLPYLVILFGLTIALTNFYTGTYLQYRITLQSASRLSLLASSVSTIAFIIALQIENYNVTLAAAMLMLITNNIGLMPFLGYFTYFVEDLLSVHLCQQLALTGFILLGFLTHDVSLVPLVTTVCGLVLSVRLKPVITLIDEEEDTSGLMD